MSRRWIGAKSAANASWCKSPVAACWVKKGALEAFVPDADAPCRTMPLQTRRFAVCLSTASGQRNPLRYSGLGLRARRPRRAS